MSHSREEPAAGLSPVLHLQNTSETLMVAKQAVECFFKKDTIFSILYILNPTMRFFLFYFKLICPSVISSHCF